MKVFISWSGVRSRAVAHTLRTWLKDVIQAVDPWISLEDIDKGQRWGFRLAEQLESTQAGVICLTPENLTAPWLLFEAGALSKLHQEARVCTYLIAMPYANIPPGPLSAFQHTVATKEDTHRMVRSINAVIPEGQGRLIESQLDRAFERCWPELERCLATLPEPQEPIPPPRTAKDMLQEVLETVRGLATFPLPRPSILVPAQNVPPIERLEQILDHLRSFHVYSYDEFLQEMWPEGAEDIEQHLISNSSYFEYFDRAHQEMQRLLFGTAPHLYLEIYRERRRLVEDARVLFLREMAKNGYPFHPAESDRGPSRRPESREDTGHDTSAAPEDEPP